jgi:G3E family GTPase
MDRTPMLEVLLVTGPLGSGKTTVVNRLLKAELGQGRRVAVLINEFGAVSVDGVLVGAGAGGDAERAPEAGGPPRSRPGIPELADIANLVDGCVCCSLRGDVVTTLAGWCDRPDGSRPDRVVLETTGLADPTDLVDLEQDPALAGRMRLAGCLTVVSALTPLAHFQRPLLRRQTALASQVLVSKADLDPSLAMAWESQIRAAFPGQLIRPARMGVAADPVDPWAGVVPALPAGDPAGPVGFTGARALTLRWDHPVDPEGLEALFLRAPDQGELLRAKGICAFPGWPARHDGSDRWAFQWADGRLDVSPLPLPPGGEPPPLVAVVIGLGLAWDTWRGALRHLERPPAGARHRVPLRPPKPEC